MQIMFSAESISVENDNIYGSGCVTVRAEVEGRDLAAELDLDDRLHDLHARDIIDTAGASKLLDAFTPAEFTNWITASMSDGYIDMLNAIGLDAIHEYLSHVE